MSFLSEERHIPVILPTLTPFIFTNGDLENLPAGVIFHRTCFSWYYVGKSGIYVFCVNYAVLSH